MREITETEFPAEVLNDTGLVLVGFCARWSAPCRMMSMLIRQLENEGVLSPKVVRVEVTDAMELSTQYEITVTPTFLLFREGELVRRQHGIMGRNALLEWIDKAK